MAFERRCMLLGRRPSSSSRATWPPTPLSGWRGFKRDDVPSDCIVEDSVIHFTGTIEP